MCFNMAHRSEFNLVRKTPGSLAQGFSSSTNARIVADRRDAPAALQPRDVRELHRVDARALVAADGTEAVALYAQHKNEVAVVLTDVMMPYMDGPLTIRALQKLNPQVKIIASSGLADSVRMGEANGAVKRFLPKPYTAEKLLTTLRELLHEN